MSTDTHKKNHRANLAREAEVTRLRLELRSTRAERDELVGGDDPEVTFDFGSMTEAQEMIDTRERAIALLNDELAESKSNFEVAVVAGNNCATELEAAKEGAYKERNHCVAYIARLAFMFGWKVGKALHPESDETWEKDWRHILFIDSPGGQLSWHFHDSEWEPLGLDALPDYDGEWDGHTTEEKYARMLIIIPAAGGTP